MPQRAAVEAHPDRALPGRPEPELGRRRFDERTDRGRDARDPAFVHPVPAIVEAHRREPVLERHPEAPRVGRREPDRARGEGRADVGLDDPGGGALHLVQPRPVPNHQELAVRREAGGLRVARAEPNHRLEQRCHGIQVEQPDARRDVQRAAVADDVGDRTREAGAYVEACQGRRGLHLANGPFEREPQYAGAIREDREAVVGGQPRGEIHAAQRPAAPRIEDHRAAADRRQPQRSVGQRHGLVQRLALQDVVDFCRERRERPAVVPEQALVEGAEQQVGVAVRHQHLGALFGEGFAARDELKLVVHHPLEPHALLVHVVRITDEEPVQESALRLPRTDGPGLTALGFATGSEPDQDLSRLEVDALRCDERRPDVVERAVRLFQL